MCFFLSKCLIFKKKLPWTKKENHVYSFSFFFIVIFILILVSVNTCSNDEKSSATEEEEVEKEFSDAVESGDKEVEKEKVKEWKFTFDEDEMNSSRNVYARISSLNTIAQDFPYGATGANICIRYMKKYGYDVLVTIDEGQFSGIEVSGTNYIMVRFDKGKAIKYWYSNPDDGSSDCVFIRKANDFIKRCKEAKDIKIELPLFQNGRPVFKFHVDKPLVWRTK